MTDKIFECIILAAGLGKRMLPLTQTIPKPLLEINNKSLIQYHLDELYKINCSNIVITNYWKGNMIEEKFKSIEFKDYKIKHSKEEKLLGVGGGIYNAMKLLEMHSNYFCVINGDIFIPNFDYHDIKNIIDGLQEENRILAYLYLIPNPDHNKAGDFYLEDDLILLEEDKNVNKINNNNKYTFSGIAIYHYNFFEELKKIDEDNKQYDLFPLLKSAISQKLVAGKLYEGKWHDVGTLERLKKLNVII